MQCLDEFGTPLEMVWSTLRRTMKTPKSTTDLLKRQARRLLLAGDVERYLKILGRLYALRTPPHPALG